MLNSISWCKTCERPTVTSLRGSFFYFNKPSAIISAASLFLWLRRWKLILRGYDYYNAVPFSFARLQGDRRRLLFTCPCHSWVTLAGIEQRCCAACQVNVSSLLQSFFAFPSRAGGGSFATDNIISCGVLFPLAGRLFANYLTHTDRPNA